MFAPGPVSGSAVGSGVLETEADFEADLVIGSIPGARSIHLLFQWR